MSDETLALTTENVEKVLDELEKMIEGNADEGKNFLKNLLTLLLTVLFQVKRFFILQVEKGLG